MNITITEEGNQLIEVAGSSPAPATQSEGVICQQITPFFIFVQSVPLFHFFDYLCKI